MLKFVAIAELVNQIKGQVQMVQTPEFMNAQLSNLPRISC